MNNNQSVLADGKIDPVAEIDNFVAAELSMARGLLDPGETMHSTGDPDANRWFFFSDLTGTLQVGYSTPKKVLYRSRDTAKEIQKPEVWTVFNALPQLSEMLAKRRADLPTRLATAN